MNFDSGVLQIAIEDIIPNRFQPRLAFDNDSLQELSDSIKVHGIIQPLVLRRVGDKYEIIAGERRYKAATMAGLATVPAVISQIDDKSSAEVAVVENIQRKNLTAIEEAKSYKALLDIGAMSQEQLAKKMGLSQSAISNKLRLLNLSDKVQEAVMDGKISERHARSLLNIADKNKQEMFLDRIINERLTVRALDELISKEGNFINNNVEMIKQNSEDLVIPNYETNVVSPVSQNVGPINLGEKIENKFFNSLEDETVNMNQTETVSILSNPTFMNFDLPKEEAKIEEPILNEEIETLDFDLPSALPEDNSNVYNDIMQSDKFANATDEVNALVDKLNNNYIVAVSQNKLDNEVTYIITVKSE